MDSIGNSKTLSVAAPLLGGAMAAYSPHYLAPGVRTAANLASLLDNHNQDQLAQQRYQESMGLRRRSMIDRENEFDANQKFRNRQEMDRTLIGSGRTFVPSALPGPAAGMPRAENGDFIDKATRLNNNPPLIISSLGLPVRDEDAVASGATTKDQWAIGNNLKSLQMKQAKQSHAAQGQNGSLKNTVAIDKAATSITGQLGRSRAALLKVQKAYRSDIDDCAGDPGCMNHVSRMYRDPINQYLQDIAMLQQRRKQLFNHSHAPVTRKRMPTSIPGAGNVGGAGYAKKHTGSRPLATSLSKSAAKQTPYDLFANDGLLPSH